MKTPKVIWLQVDRSEDDDWETDEVTWCVDKINDTDIRYIIDKRYFKRT